jgi:hypothetical protein
MSKVVLHIVSYLEILYTMIAPHPAGAPMNSYGFLKKMKDSLCAIVVASTQTSDETGKAIYEAVDHNSEPDEPCKSPLSVRTGIQEERSYHAGRHGATAHWVRQLCILGVR